MFRLQNIWYEIRDRGGWGRSESPAGSEFLVHIGGFTTRRIEDPEVIKMIEPLRKFFQRNALGRISVLVTLKDGREVRYCHLSHSYGLGLEPYCKPKERFSLWIPFRDYVTEAPFDPESFEIKDIIKIRRVTTGGWDPRTRGISIWRQKGDIGEIWCGLFLENFKGKTARQLFEVLKNNEGVREAIKNNLGISLWVDDKEVVDLDAVIKKGYMFRVYSKYICERDS